MNGRGGAQMSFGPPETPEIIKNLMIANGVVFIAQLIGPGMGLNVTDLGVVSPKLVWEDFQIWRIFTYMWLHSPTGIMHIAFNMFSLWMFGSAVAQLWGEQRFMKYYLVCGVGAGFNLRERYLRFAGGHIFEFVGFDLVENIHEAVLAGH